jgi:hypothetical protein
MRSRRRPHRIITAGIEAALVALLRRPEITHGAIDGVVIGTTHFCQRRRAASRFGGRCSGAQRLPASASLPPFCDWPEDLAARVRGGVFMLAGRDDYDGRPIVPLD